MLIRIKRIIDNYRHAAAYRYDMMRARNLTREIEAIDSQLDYGRQRIEHLNAERDLLCYRLGMARTRILAKYGDRAVFGWEWS